MTDPKHTKQHPNLGWEKGSAEAKAHGAKGGQASAEAKALRRMLGLKELSPDHDYRPYLRLARAMRDAHGGDLASSVGGGHLSPGVGSVLSTAALTLAASRYLFDLAAEKKSPELFRLAALLGDKSRAALVSANSMAKEEAAARSTKQRSSDPLSEFRAQPSLPAAGEPVADHESEPEVDGDDSDGPDSGAASEG